ncbi:MAG: hypothetical protein QM766_06760 [Burkholderiaceae bacterium]
MRQTVRDFADPSARKRSQTVRSASQAPPASIRCRHGTPSASASTAVAIDSRPSSTINEAPASIRASATAPAASVRGGSAESTGAEATRATAAGAAGAAAVAATSARAAATVSTGHLAFNASAATRAERESGGSLAGACNKVFIIVDGDRVGTRPVSIAAVRTTSHSGRGSRREQRCEAPAVPVADRTICI